MIALISPTGVFAVSKVLIRAVAPLVLLSTLSCSDVLANVAETDELLVVYCTMTTELMADFILVVSFTIILWLVG